MVHEASLYVVACVAATLARAGGGSCGQRCSVRSTASLCVRPDCGDRCGVWIAGLEGREA